VRELENVIERACVLTRGSVIDVDDLPRLVRDERQVVGKDAAAPPSASLRDLEAHHIRQVLDQTGWNFKQAAEILGVHRNTLRLKIKEYALERS
jgi:DNA-binding NtrC family response regulator